jgi:hypothetical protein
MNKNWQPAGRAQNHKEPAPETLHTSGGFQISDVKCIEIGRRRNNQNAEEFLPGGESEWNNRIRVKRRRHQGTLLSGARESWNLALLEAPVRAAENRANRNKTGQIGTRPQRKSGRDQVRRQQSKRRPAEAEVTERWRAWAMAKNTGCTVHRAPVLCRLTMASG